MAYEQLRSQLATWPLHEKTVLVRADLNVPLQHGTIKDETRLQALVPTLDFIRQAGGTSIVITHIDRPVGRDERFSTRHLVPWFQHHGFNIAFCTHPSAATCVAENPQVDIILMENSRFWPQEYTQNEPFAQTLARGMDYYVNDAFGAEHRTDTTLTIVPLQFSPQRRSIGFLVERELAALSKLTNNPEHPYVVIVGGKKVPDKLAFLDGLINTADTLLICPALSFTLQAANGTETVGKSLVDSSSYEQARLLAHKISASNTHVLLPIDYLVAQNSWDGPLSYNPTAIIAPNDLGVACGPATIAQWKLFIAQAKTIFFNGPMGDLERPQTLRELRELLEAITSNTHAYRVIGGGDSLAAAHLFGLADKFDFCSTGGGATLAFLANKPLPGLAPFLTKN